MKNKKTLILDMDNTITNSIETIVNIIKEETGDNTITYNQNFMWDFRGVLDEKYKERAIQLFNEEKFFDRLTMIKSAYDVIKELNEHYIIKICSVHKNESKQLKIDWVKKHLPFIKEENIIIIDYNDGFDKSKTYGDIIIDDNPRCLFGKRQIRILFGDYGYNKIENLNLEEKSNLFVRAYTWEDVRNLLLK